MNLDFILSSFFNFNCKKYISSPKEEGRKPFTKKLLLIKTPERSKDPEQTTLDQSNTSPDSDLGNTGEIPRVSSMTRWVQTPTPQSPNKVHVKTLKDDPVFDPFTDLPRLKITKSMQDQSIFFSDKDILISLKKIYNGKESHACQFVEWLDSIKVVPNSEEEKCIDRVKNILIDYVVIFEKDNQMTQAIMASLEHSTLFKYGWISLKGIRNLFGYTAHWLNSKTKTSLLDSFLFESNKKQCELVAKMFNDEFNVIKDSIKGMEEMYNLMIQTKKGELPPKLKPVLTYHTRYEMLYRELTDKGNHLWASGNPRSPVLWTWIAPGCEGHSPIPKAIGEAFHEYYHRLYSEIHIPMVLFNAMLDDLADEFMDQELCELADSIFPKTYDTTYFIKVTYIKNGDEVECRLNNEQQVRDYLSWLINDQQKYEKFRRLETEVINYLVMAWEVFTVTCKNFKSLYNELNIVKKLNLEIGLDITAAKSIAVVFPEDLPWPKNWNDQQEKLKTIFEEALQHKDEKSASDLTISSEKEALQNKIIELLKNQQTQSTEVKRSPSRPASPSSRTISSGSSTNSIEADLTDRMIEFFNSNNVIFTRPRTNSSLDEDPIIKKIVQSYSFLISNFLNSVRFNKGPNASTLAVYNGTAHHNMNIIIFLETYIMLTMSIPDNSEPIEEINSNDIIRFLNDPGVRNAIESVQKMARRGNVLATAVTKGVELSRELKVGDITGIAEIIEFIFQKLPAEQHKMSVIFKKLNEPLRSQHKKNIIENHFPLTKNEEQIFTIDCIKEYVNIYQIEGLDVSQIQAATSINDLINELNSFITTPNTVSDSLDIEKIESHAKVTLEKVDEILMSALKHLQDTNWTIAENTQTNYALIKNNNAILSEFFDSFDRSYDQGISSAKSQIEAKQELGQDTTQDIDNLILRLGDAGLIYFDKTLAFQSLNQIILQYKDSFPELIELDCINLESFDQLTESIKELELELPKLFLSNSDSSDLDALDKIERWDEKLKEMIKMLIKNKINKQLLEIEEHLKEECSKFDSKAYSHEIIEIIDKDITEHKKEKRILAIKQMVEILQFSNAETIVMHQFNDHLNTFISELKKLNEFKQQQLINKMLNSKEQTLTIEIMPRDLKELVNNVNNEQDFENNLNTMIEYIKEEWNKDIESESIDNFLGKIKEEALKRFHQSEVSQEEKEELKELHRVDEEQYKSELEKKEKTKISARIHELIKVYYSFLSLRKHNKIMAMLFGEKPESRVLWLCWFHCMGRGSI